VTIDLVPHDLLEHAVELAEVTEDDVAPLVPCEALGVDVGRRVAPRVLVAFDERPAFVSETVELARASEPTGARANDYDMR
jgi:hypothetical protein